MTFASLAARNVMRNKFRTILTMVGVAVAVLAFSLLRTVIGSWSEGSKYASKDRLGTRNKVSFVVHVPLNYAKQVGDVKGVSKVTWATWFGGKNPKNENDFFATIAVDSNTFFDVYDDMKIPADQLEAWKHDKQGVILGDMLAKHLKLKVGDTTTITGSIYPGDWKFNVDGIYTTTARGVDRNQFLFHWDMLNESDINKHKDTIGWIVSKIDDPNHGADISAAIDKVFDEKDTQTLTMSERNMQLSFMAMFSAILSAIDVVSVVILLIMMLILGNTIAMGVRERTSEYGTLRAIGFLPKHVAGFILGEGLFTGLLGGLAGLALATPIIMGAGKFFEENMAGMFPHFAMSPTTASLALVFSVTLGTIASLLPAYRASKLNVTDALRRVG